MIGRRSYFTNTVCPFCKGKGCLPCDRCGGACVDCPKCKGWNCEGTGHGWQHIHHDGRCWCGNYGMHHIADQNRWLCRAHTFWWETQPDGTVIERMPTQLGPHPEAAHLHPGVQPCQTCRRSSM